MQVLDFAAFRAAPLVRNPFDYLILPRFVRPEACAAINADYPAIAEPGSFPLGQLYYGPGFRSLIDALEGDEMRVGVRGEIRHRPDGRPTTITVRGRCGTRDGNIHTDSASKLITVLIYMNPAWEAAGGRLRLLRSGQRPGGRGRRGAADRRDAGRVPPQRQLLARPQAVHRPAAGDAVQLGHRAAGGAS